MSYGKPLPRVNADSVDYWRAAREGRLVFQQCRACGQNIFYPRIACTNCLSTALEWREASGRGRIYASTICFRAPDQAFRAEVPYVIALIDLDEGLRMMSNVTHCEPDRVRIGDEVEVWFEEATDEIGIPRFKLSRKAAS